MEAYLGLLPVALRPSFCSVAVLLLSSGESVAPRRVSRQAASQLRASQQAHRRDHHASDL